MISTTSLPFRSPAVVLLASGLLVGWLLAGCDRTDAAKAKPDTATPPAGDIPQIELPGMTIPDPRVTNASLEAAALGVDHDFGIIPHRETATHDLAIEVPDNAGPGGDYIPLRYTRNCSCARHQFVITDVDGKRRYPTGQAIPEFAVREGELLEVHLEVHTDEKEAIDLAPVVITGFITLQTEAPPHSRFEIPIRFRFGISSPVVVHPSPTIDLGKLPPSLEYSRQYYLSGKTGEPRVTFSDPVCTEPDPETLDARRVAGDVTCRLESQADGRTLLNVSMQPGEDRPTGPFAMRIELQTDLPSGYVLHLPVSGIAIPNIELGIPGKIMFGQIPFDKPDSQSLWITDHDKDQPSGFFALSILDHNGETLTEHFKAKIVPVEEHPRTQRVILDYLGTLTNRDFVRGTVALAKDPLGPAVKKVEFVAFRRR